MGFASRSGLVKRVVITVVAVYSGKNWPKDNKKYSHYTKLDLESGTELCHFNKCFQMK